MNENKWTTEPTSETINLAFLSNEGGDTVIRIIDINGQTKIVKNESTYKGRNTVRMSVKELPHGNYFIQVNNGKEQINQRFVKF